MSLRQVTSTWIETWMLLCQGKYICRSSKKQQKLKKKNLNGALQKEQGTGTKREPWGTPQQTDDKWTEKFPSDKYNWNYIKAVPVISTFNSSCDRDKLWSILSNVAVRSKTTRTAELLATKLKSKPLKTLRRTFSVLWGCHGCQQRNKKGKQTRRTTGLCQRPSSACDNCLTFSFRLPDINHYRHFWFTGTNVNLTLFLFSLSNLHILHKSI